ncbi:MAG: ABC transporter substrate-binding protein [Thermoleophilia bacterium]|nr:ABC transporter substrate-binding protein [Thermoleophilia bacterium]
MCTRPLFVTMAVAATCVVAVPAASQAADIIATGGSLASMTGSASPYGISQARGASLAAQHSRPGPVRVRLHLADDQSTDQMGINQMIGFTGARVAAVLGPTLSGVAAAADPIAGAAGIPVLGVTNTTLDIADAGPTFWRVSLSENRLIPASVAYANDTRGVTTASLVSVTGDGYSEGAAQAFRTAAAAQGIRLLADVSMPTGSAQAASLIAQATAPGPQAIFFAARSRDAVNLAVAAAGSAAVKVGGNGYNTPDVLGAAGTATDGFIVSASWNPGKRDARSRAFVRAYRAKYRGTPSAFAAQGYAGVQLLEAAATAGKGGTPDRVLAGLRRLRAVPTVLGTMRFTRGVREAVYPATVQVVRGGRLLLAPRS